MTTFRGNMGIIRVLKHSVSFQKWKFARHNIALTNFLGNVEPAANITNRQVRTSALCLVNRKRNPEEDAKQSSQASPPLVAQLLSKHSEEKPSGRDIGTVKVKSAGAVNEIYSSMHSTMTDTDLPSRMAEWKKELDEIEHDARALMNKKEHVDNLATAIDYSSSLTDATSSNDNENFVEFVTLDDESPKTTEEKPKKKPSIYGTPNPEIPRSDIPCVGCGALLHCQEEREHGYMPSEKFTSLTSAELRQELCQRCFLIKHHKIYLNVGVTTKEYPAIIEKIKTTKSLVMVVVDLTDIQNSIYSELLDHIGTDRPLYVIGNKADLIPGDQRGYLKHLKEALVSACEQAGLNPTGHNLQHVCVVSARTGYGVEDLITHLMTHWGNKGDVYLVGSTNAGKSTLFNALLASDYCKSNVRNIIHRATASNWPGTTLNLLKFPIVTPTPWRVKQRNKRLAAVKEQEKLERGRVRMEPEERRPKPSLLAHIGTTDFQSEEAREKEEEKARRGEGQELVSFQLDGDTTIVEAPEGPRLPTEEELLRERYHTMYQHSRWHYDTPGVIREEQVINQLTEEELWMLMPKGQLKPRVHVVKPGHALLVSGLGRLDYVEGSKSAFFTVVSSKSIPTFVKPLEEVEDFYREHLGTRTLGIPLGDAERLNQLPPLLPTEFTLTCHGFDSATADIQLSSLGWVAVAGGYQMEVRLRAYTVGGRGCYLRQPPLLPFYRKFRGRRMGRSSEYQPITPVL